MSTPGAETAWQPLPSPSENLLVSRQGAIGRVVFSRPERMNAVSFEMWAALPEIMNLLEADSEIRVIVLTGAGDKAFVAGADISQFGEARADASAGAAYEDANENAFTAIAEVDKPTIAMIDGYCIGGGLAIALSCDLRFAAEGSTFAIPAAKLGLGYPPGGIKKLMGIVGPAFAREIFYTARRFDHAEALAMGLVNRVLPRTELESYTDRICADIAANAPLTIKAAKHTIGAILDDPADYDRAKIDVLVEACFDSEDYREGRAAFLEKRPPRFEGR